MAEYNKNIHRKMIYDGNGNPIPQKFDPTANDGAGGFVPLSSDNPMEVSQNGSIIELIKLRENIPYDSANWIYNMIHVGENESQGGSTVIPIETKDYPHIDIAFHNNTDVALEIGVSIFPVAQKEINYLGLSIFRNQWITSMQVNSGESNWLRSINEPELNRVRALYLTLKQVTSNPTSGDFTFIIIGSKV